MGTDDTLPGSDDSPLPERQTWYPAQRRFYYRFFSVGAVIMAAAAVFAMVSRDADRWPMFAVLFGLQSALLVGQARFHKRTWLEADATGLHHVVGRTRTTLLWEEITEIRPSIAKGPPTFLVAVRESRPTVDLPVTEEHLDELRRWHSAARSSGEGPVPRRGPGAG